MSSLYLEDLQQSIISCKNVIDDLYLVKVNDNIETIGAVIQLYELKFNHLQSKYNEVKKSYINIKDLYEGMNPISHYITSTDENRRSKEINLITTKEKTTAIKRLKQVKKKIENK